MTRFILLFLLLPWGSAVAQETTPPATLGLDFGIDTLDAGHLELRLVRASQTVAGFVPYSSGGFDFTPSDWLERRDSDGFYHLGDLNMRVRRAGEEAWTEVSTAAARAPVQTYASPPPGRTKNQDAALFSPGSSAADITVLASADLSSTLPVDSPLRVERTWLTDGTDLVLRFDLANDGPAPQEIGALGIPMVFNNILHRRSLDEAHQVASFHDPYIGMDAGYVQVTRLSGEGPALLVVPAGDTPFEAWRPLLDDPTPRGITFEGFYEWMVHSRAYAENEWAAAEPWNEATSAMLDPGASLTVGLRFLVAPSIREIEDTLVRAGRPVAVGIPGYVLPMDQEASLYVRSQTSVEAIEVQPPGALEIEQTGFESSGRKVFTVRGNTWGRARLTLTYRDGMRQAVHYKVLKPLQRVVDDLGHFLLTEQWFDDDKDPFGRGPGIISYDWTNQRQVTEDNRAWIAGLGDEGGAGSWLAAFMKQLIRPDRDELRKLERFVDETLWGGLQYTDGNRAFGVRKSLFWYEPDQVSAGTYTDSVRYGGWASWSREHAETVGRSYNYPHVAAAYWVMYRLARNHDGLVTNHPWQWYLERAFETGEAMVRLAPDYAQFGQMEGTVFLLILRDMQREEWTDQSAALEASMRTRAEHWQSLGYPYGSEMPWDSTGQEEVYAWCRYFGFDEKAAVTLNAILGYMPTVPHWGYNGSARRYWDFQYAGHPATSRLERQLHHYGSGLNAIPVLTEFRDHPSDLYLLRVGYGGLMGAVSNITPEGFGPSGFHSYPSTLRIDGYSGDYGPGFLGHAVNTGTYVVQDPELGWQAFGGRLTERNGQIEIAPLDAARSRVFLAPLGLWLELDAGTFEMVRLDPETGALTLMLSPADDFTPVARLRVARTNPGAGYRPDPAVPMERGAYVIELGSESVEVDLTIR